MDIQQMVQRVAELQEELKKRQEELAVMTFESSSGGGMVTATVNGKMDLIRLKIDPSIVNKEEVCMLQDLVVAAVGDAKRKAEEAAKRFIGGMMGI